MAIRPHFAVTPQPTRVLFGSGSLERLAVEASTLGQRALVLTTPGQHDLGRRALALLGPSGAGLHAGARIHVPQATIDEASIALAASGADLLIPVGGGSAIGLAKGLALRTGLPILAVPTTYAGSEMTPVWGVSEGGRKATGRDIRVLPRAVIYDPVLTLAVPTRVLAASGMNAMAHAAEALYATDANPVTDLLAEEAVRLLADSLPAVVDAPDAPDPRAAGLQGAWLAGTVLGQCHMGLHHKLCHVLGGGWDLPHAESHALLLPYVLAFNLPAASAAAERLGRALAVPPEEVPWSLRALHRRLDLPASLAALGLPRDGLDRAAELATTTAYPNPRAVTRAEVLALLERAWHGSD